MRFSKKGVLILAILLMSLQASAVPDTNKASSWLANSTNFDQDTETVAFSILALGLSDKAGDAQQGIARLIDRQDATGCWPKGNCRVKDTSLAVLALSHFNRPSSAARSWLLSSRLPASTTGKFWIQVAASSDGQCKVLYDGKSKTFTLKNGNVVECGNKPWIETSCIDTNLLKSAVEKTIDVDCSSLQSSSIISLIFQQGNSYYILDEQHTNFAKLKISNACLGSTKTSTSCDYDSTLFATFAMAQIGQNLGTQTYLESNIQSNSIIGYSFLYFLTKKEVYRDILEQKQLASGSFSNVYQTGLAMIALQNTPAGNNASAWLESQQSEDGSWNRNVRDTSTALYGLLFRDTSSSLESCVGQGNLCCSACSEDGDAFGSLDDTCREGQSCCSACSAEVLPTCSEIGGIECNFDQRCIAGDIQETQDSLYCCVAGTCQDVTTTTSTVLPTCNFDDICDLDETEESCPNDCGKSNWLLYLFYSASGLFLAGLIYYLVKTGKIKFKKHEREEPKPVQRPAYPVFRQQVRQPLQQPQRPFARKRGLKSNIEKELDKSLEEAKKLLKGDKK